MTNLLPFGQRGGRLYSVERVARGINCGCVCPDPQCGLPLVARQGGVNVWHFAHAGGEGGVSCSGGESGLHRYAKQVLCESAGRVFTLPHRENKDFYNGYDGMLRITQAKSEACILGTSRRCDVLLIGKVRKAENRREWLEQAQVGVEIAVTHYKDQAYQDEIRQAGQLSVLEVPLSWDFVRSEAERLSKQYTEVVKHILLNQSSEKEWLFKRGSEAWVCPGCGRFKHRHRTICYDCASA